MVLGSFTGIRIGLSTIKAFCDVKKKSCTSISSLEALAYTINDDNCYICSMIDAKHSNVYACVFDKQNQNLVKYTDFIFDSIDNLLLVLGSLKKKIFFVGNCGILYKDMIQSYMKIETYFTENTLVYSKYIGFAAFDKFKNGEILNSHNISALYLKKSSAEEHI